MISIMNIGFHQVPPLTRFMGKDRESYSFLQNSIILVKFKLELIPYLINLFICQLGSWSLPSAVSFTNRSRWPSLSSLPVDSPVYSTTSSLSLSRGPNLGLYTLCSRSVNGQPKVLQLDRQDTRRRGTQLARDWVSKTRFSCPQAVIISHHTHGMTMSRENSSSTSPLYPRLRPSRSTVKSISSRSRISSTVSI